LNFSFWENFAIKKKDVDHKVHEHDVNLLNFIAREHKKKGVRARMDINPGSHLSCKPP
jgi:hypothetical protein